MAINKKLIHFKSKENFNREVANENILDTSICFIQDSKEISTHGTIYKSVNWSVLTYAKEYFTIEALEDGLTARLSTNACEYRIDNGDWKTLSEATDTEIINRGQTLYFRGNLTPVQYEGIGTFTISKKCNVKGNIMSLLYSDNFEEHIDLTGKNHAFFTLFDKCTNIVDASELILPAITLVSSCYKGMFRDCTSLTTAPELPATTLVYRCYQSMFSGCSSLTTATELPAIILADECYLGMFSGCSSLTTATELPSTTLTNSCYSGMFRDCTSLTTAPELPATTMTNYCYNCMFKGCSKLNYIKMLATDISASNCLSSWVDGVATTGTFVKNKNATWDKTGTSGIPEGWTVLNA